MCARRNDLYKSRKLLTNAVNYCQMPTNAAIYWQMRQMPNKLVVKVSQISACRLADALVPCSVFRVSWVSASLLDAVLALCSRTRSSCSSAVSELLFAPVRERLCSLRSSLSASVSASLAFLIRNALALACSDGFFFGGIVRLIPSNLGARKQQQPYHNCMFLSPDSVLFFLFTLLNVSKYYSVILFFILITRLSKIKTNLK